MQGLLLQLISRRLPACTSQLRPPTRFSTAREEPSTKNLSETIQTPTREQNPSAPNSEPHPNSYLNPNLHGSPDPHLQYNFTSVQNSTLDLASSHRQDSNTNPHSDASIPQVDTNIWAVERLSKGRRYSQGARVQDRVPGFVIDQRSPDEKHVLVLMDRYQIQSLWGLLGEERFLSTIFTLEIFDGYGSRNVLYQERVLPRRLNYAKDGRITNVGFVKAPPGTKLRLEVPILISGQEDCRGVKKGGFLIVHLSYASLFCLPEELPPFFEIHVNDLDIGEKICLGDLRTDLELHSNNRPSLPICEIMQAHTVK